jgi:thiamine-monophosphate kinase
LSELSRLEKLRHFFASGGLPREITVGIGDDAAVLAPDAEPLVWTIDAAVSGVHFRRDWMSLEDVGYRSLMAAASDIAAMGARPRGVLSALILPSEFSDDDLAALLLGQRDAATALGTAVIGGNLASGSELSITTTVLGCAASPLLRSGARGGDVVAIAGVVGLARAGIEALGRGVIGAAVESAIATYRRPRARIAEGRAASPHARAAIDVSDGLALDVARLAAESGVRIVLDETAVQEAGGPELDVAAEALGQSALELALYGGDDYALVMTFARENVPTAFLPIGQCTAGSGVALKERSGTVRDLAPRGFDHFAK